MGSPEEAELHNRLQAGRGHWLIGCRWGGTGPPPQLSPPKALKGPFFWFVTHPEVSRSHVTRGRDPNSQLDRSWARKIQAENKMIRANLKISGDNHFNAYPSFNKSKSAVEIEKH